MSALAEEAVSALVHRPHDALVSDDPGLCHGRAGILHTTVRMAAATGRATLWETADHLARELVAEFDDRTPFGYPQVLRPPSASIPSPPPAPRRMHHPGLLDGATGIALVLADYADARRGTTQAERNGWDAALLMS